MDIVAKIRRITHPERATRVNLILPAVELFIAFKHQAITAIFGLKQEAIRLQVDTLYSANVAEVDDTLWRRGLCAKKEA
jgi:hypothetical protein